MQLADGTHLTLDETALQAGTLGTIGVQNLEVLKHLLEWQKVRASLQLRFLSWEPESIPLGTIYVLVSSFADILRVGILHCNELLTSRKNPAHHKVFLNFFNVMVIGIRFICPHVESMLN